MKGWTSDNQPCPWKVAGGQGGPTDSTEMPLAWVPWLRGPGGEQAHSFWVHRTWRPFACHWE